MNATETIQWCERQFQIERDLAAHYSLRGWPADANYHRGQALKLRRIMQGAVDWATPGTVGFVARARRKVGPAELRRRACLLLACLPEEARRDAAGRPAEAVAFETAARLTTENNWIEEGGNL